MPLQVQIESGNGSPGGPLSCLHSHFTSTFEDICLTGPQKTTMVFEIQKNVKVQVSYTAYLLTTYVLSA
jgi:hypothetical protein